jgi:hypothetical protein
MFQLPLIFLRSLHCSEMTVTYKAQEMQIQILYWYISYILQVIAKEFNRRHIWHVNVWMKLAGLLHIWHAQEDIMPLLRDHGSFNGRHSKRQTPAHTSAWPEIIRQHDASFFAWSAIPLFCEMSLNTMSSTFRKGTGEGLDPGARGLFPTRSELQYKEVAGRSIPGESISRQAGHWRCRDVALRSVTPPGSGGYKPRREGSHCVPLTMNARCSVVIPRLWRKKSDIGCGVTCYQYSFVFLSEAKWIQVLS